MAEQIRPVSLVGRNCGSCLTGTLYALSPVVETDHLSKVQCWKCRTMYYRWQSASVETKDGMEITKILRYCRTLRPDSQSVRHALACQDAWFPRLGGGNYNRWVPEATSARMWTCWEQEHPEIPIPLVQQREEAKESKRERARDAFEFPSWDEFEDGGYWPGGHVVYHHDRSGWRARKKAEFDDEFTPFYPWNREKGKDHIMVGRTHWEAWTGEEVAS